MAIHYLQSNMADQDIALDEIRDDPTYDDAAGGATGDDDVMSIDETGFGGGTVDVAPVETPLTLSQQGQLKQTAIDAVYKKWGIPEGGVDPNNFVYTKEKRLKPEKVSGDPPHQYPY